MTQTSFISEEIKKSLRQVAPDVLDSYQSCLAILEDIEIQD